MRYTLLCPACGKEYQTGKYEVNHGRVYCSRECKDKHNNKSGKLHWHWKGGKIRFSCFKCGRFTYKKRRKTNTNVHTFCSNTCKNMFYKPLQKVKETRIETKVAEILKRKGIKNVPQKRLRNICIPDFYLPDKRIAIFCDGDYWHNYPVGKKRDSKQISEIAKFGIVGLRFWERDIMKNGFEDILLLQIQNASIKAKQSHP